LRDKTLAGKQALFDVTVLEASKRTLPEVTDEFSANVRAGLTAETLIDELKKAVDSEAAKEFKPTRNAALCRSLAEVMDVDVPDTLVTNQAREKFAMMMTDMRNGGVSDEEIKKQISGENFLKYKKIVKDDIIKDFKVSMATDEVARLEGIEVPDYQVEEQMESIKQDAAENKEDFDEAQMRSRIEATLVRDAVMDFLADNGNLQVDYTDGEEFDEALMQTLAEESLAREEQEAEAAAEETEEGESAAPEIVDAVVVEEEAPAVEERAAPEPVAEAEEESDESPAQGSDETAPADRDYASMTLEDKAYYSLLDSGALDTKET
jgi:trigger factor